MNKLGFDLSGSRLALILWHPFGGFALERGPWTDCCARATLLSGRRNHASSHIVQYAFCTQTLAELFVPFCPSETEAGLQMNREGSPPTPIGCVSCSAAASLPPSPGGQVSPMFGRRGETKQVKEDRFCEASNGEITSKERWRDLCQSRGTSFKVADMHAN